MNLKFLGLVLAVLLLTGCPSMPQIVQTPIALPCPPKPDAVRPALIEIPQDAEFDQIAMIQAKNLTALMDYSLYLEKIEGCNP